jgi:hypothetical protein
MGTSVHLDSQNSMGSRVWDAGQSKGWKENCGILNQLHEHFMKILESIQN